MKAVFIIGFAIFYLHTLASDSIPTKKNNYKTKLVTMDGEIYKGFLSHLDDSIVYISDVPIIYGQPDLRYTNRFSYTDITEINLRRRGSAGRGILYGSLAGGLIGANAKKTFTIGGKREKFDTMKMNF